MDIYEQGSLDGLCGLYALINSIIRLDPTIDTKSLFAHCIASLGSHLPTIITEGMDEVEFEKFILRSCIVYLHLHQKMLWFQCKRFRQLNHFWNRSEQHYSEHGAGSLLVGITGRLAHWTCVERVTPKSLLLADSSGMRRLSRRHLTVKAPNNFRPYSITHSYFLTLEKY